MSTELNEFAPGSGGGESGRWYTDDQMTDLVGDGWWDDLDISGDISKQQMIEQAQAWLDDQGYSVQVLNCKVNDDNMEWYIEGSFHNPRFAKKGVAEKLGDNRPKLGSKRDAGKSVRKWRSERGLDEVDAQNFVGGMTAGYQRRENQPVDENQGWAATYEALKPDAFAALQQAKQNIEQNRQQEVDQWEQDFRANSAKLARQQLKQRFTAPPPPAPIPVARPGEGYYALKDRLAQLDIAKQKFEEFNKLVASIKKKYPLVADTLDQLENSLLQDVKDGAADNYASLLTKLSKYETALTTRFPGIVKEDPDYIDEASRT